MSDILGTQFWDKLKEICSAVGMKPEDLIAVMSYESGLDPAAHNKNGNASGLIQFMPDTLHGLGYKGTDSDFRTLDAINQLDYVSKYITNQTANNGGPFKSAAQYYVGNLWPVALKLQGVRDQDPDTVILYKDPPFKRWAGVSIDQERAGYKGNAGLDVDHDGKITFGDLQRVMNGIKNSHSYMAAVDSLHNNKELAVGKPQAAQNKSMLASNTKPTSAPTPASTPSQSPMDRFEQLIDKYVQMFANADDISIKKLYKYALLTHNILIQVNASNYVDATEFSRILTSALDEDLLSTSYICSDGKNIEIECSIQGPEKECFAAVNQMSLAISEVFKEATAKIGGIKISTNCIMNKKSLYQPINIKTANSNYRKFLLKFIKAQ